jgi:polyisoprenoid-binding protein YceI
VSGRLRAGRIRWDATDGTGELVFDMNSFVADTEEARKYVGLSGTTDPDTQRKVTENMRGAEVLNVAEFPTARFQIKSIRKLQQASRRGLPLFQLDGDFTLQRATRPIQVVTEAEQKSGWIHLRGSFSIRQSDFGMTPYSRALGTVGVADELQIWGDLWIAQQRMAIRAPAGNVR